MAFINTKEVKRFYGPSFLEERKLQPHKVARDATMLSDMCEAINKIYSKELMKACKKKEDASKST